MASSLPEIISPHIVTGLEGTALNAAERDLLRAFPPAGIILFSRNVESRKQLSALCAEVIEIIGKASGLVPLVMADHEGGRISVLARAIGVPPTQMTAWRAFAETGDPGLPAAVFRESARRMRSCGINMFLGPVADVNSEYLNPVIGTRAFSEDADEVAKAVAAAVRTFAEEGILTSIKHFPGHGSSLEDSHLVLPTLDRTLDELRQEDVVPFMKGIEAGADSVMTAHVAPRGRNIPASLDPAVVRGILREEIGFDGVIITDGLEMSGILTGAGLVGAARDISERDESAWTRTEERIYGGFRREWIMRLKPAVVARTALEAGNDLLLFCRPAAEVYRELDDIGRFLEGDGDFWNGAFREKYADSLRRIEALRRRAGIFQPPVPAEWHYPATAGAVVEIAKDPLKLLPFGPGKVPAILFYGEEEDFARYPVTRFIDRLIELVTAGREPRVYNARHLVAMGMARSAVNPEWIDLYSFQDRSVENSRVLVLLFRKPLAPKDIGRISEGFEVVIAAERPWDSFYVKDGRTAITCYGISDSTAEAVARILVGQVAPAPVKFD
ncbi:MAG: hypothetical protein MUF59_06070 [Candidatus Krumholzibacteria bacterium]|nr:hypothetical protein [Candidatus Krumholzibacteria bacterium]